MKGSAIVWSWWLVIDIYGVINVHGYLNTTTDDRSSFDDKFRGVVLVRRLRSFHINVALTDRPVLLDPFTVVETDGTLLYKVEDPEEIALITKAVLVS